jgi:hypothetical protein
MTYAANQSIVATDYNTLVGTATSTTSGVLNTVWSTGNSNKGYGQTAVGQVTQHAPVRASEWAELVNKTANAASHQGTAVTAITAPSTGQPIMYLSALPTNLTNIYNGRNNAAAQGTTATTTTTNSTANWTQYLTFTHTVTFASGDAARYFFNAGGQIALTFSHPSGLGGINDLLNTLLSAAGTVYFSAPSSGTVNIAGTQFNGVTKIGGLGTEGTNWTRGTNIGYYGLTSSNQAIFNQIAASGLAKYLATYVNVQVRSNGTVGANGDTGSVLTFTTTVDEVPDALAVAANTAVTLTVRPPAATYISNTWGTPTVTGSVTGA